MQMQHTNHFLLLSGNQGSESGSFFCYVPRADDPELLFVSCKGWHVVELLQGVVVGDIPDSCQVEKTEKLKLELRGIWERIDAAPL